MKNQQKEKTALPVKKLIAAIGFSVISYGAIAQNSSYNANVVPISGNFNSAFGWNALNNFTTGIYNTATGNSALRSNTSGTHNTATGVNVLGVNTTGIWNTGTGVNSLLSNTTGSGNTASGLQALLSNTYGNNNTATGVNALLSNIGGYSNNATGLNSLYSNSSGYYNSASGTNSLYTNNSGYYNTAAGTNALYLNTTGFFNTAVGAYALYNNTIGYYNTALGDYAGPNTNNLINSTAVGDFTLTTASNQVRIGNSAVTSIGGQVGWTILSDKRVKKDIQEKVPGLEFINKLRPVTYYLDQDAIDAFLKTPQEVSSRLDRSAKGKILQTGLIAQEVEKAATDIGYDFNGVDKPQNEGDLYGLRYDEFTLPLIKAVQELSKQNESLKKDLEELRVLITKNSGTGSNIGDPSKNQTGLLQNVPNPFNQSTVIKYSIAPEAQNALITVTSVTGQKVKEFDLKRNNNNQAIEINAGELSAGTYIYSLIIEGKIVDTKKLILTE